MRPPSAAPHQTRRLDNRRTETIAVLKRHVPRKIPTRIASAKPPLRACNSIARCIAVTAVTASAAPANITKTPSPRPFTTVPPFDRAAYDQRTVMLPDVHKLGPALLTKRLTQSGDPTRLVTKIVAVPRRHHTSLTRTRGAQRPDARTRQDVVQIKAWASPTLRRPTWASSAFESIARRCVAALTQRVSKTSRAQRYTERARSRSGVRCGGDPAARGDTPVAWVVSCEVLLTTYTPANRPTLTGPEPGNSCVVRASRRGIGLRADDPPSVSGLRRNPESRCSLFRLVLSLNKEGRWPGLSSERGLRIRRPACLDHDRQDLRVRSVRARPSGWSTVRARRQRGGGCRGRRGGNRQAQRRRGHACRHRSPCPFAVAG